MFVFFFVPPKKVGAPVMKPLPAGSVSGTRVTFVPDLSRFSLKKDALNADLVQVFRTRCFDVAACSSSELAVTFNGESMPRSFREYFALFDLHALGSVFDEGKGFQLGVGVVESASSNTHVSFVNSINTLRGGTHVSFVLDQIAKGVVAWMKRDASLPAVSPAFVRAHLVVFLNARIPNPTFDSQTKETLTTSVDVIKDICVVSNSLIQQVRFCFVLFWWQKKYVWPCLSFF